MCNVVIIGAGGHAKVISDIILKNGDKLLGFLDDFKTGKILLGYGVIGVVSDINKFAKDTQFIIAIGDNHIRETIAKTYDVNWYTAIHPSAQIGVDVVLHKGTCVMANAVINSGSNIGEHCIINTAAIVEHDCTLLDFVHISPNAVLCGNVNIGVCGHIGASAVVKNNIVITDNVVVGAGAAVVKNIVASGTYVGVPIKKIS